MEAAERKQVDREVLAQATRLAFACRTVAEDDAERHQLDHMLEAANVCFCLYTQLCAFDAFLYIFFAVCLLLLIF